MNYWCFTACDTSVSYDPNSRYSAVCMLGKLYSYIMLMLMSM